MEYVIKVVIPDELAALCATLAAPQVAALAKDAGLVPTQAARTASAVTMDEIVAVLKRIYADPEKRDSVRADIASFGVSKVQDIPRESWDAVYGKWRALLEGGSHA